MNTYKCTYDLKTASGRYHVTDYILSTSKPDKQSIGHYWRTLFPSYTITHEKAELMPATGKLSPVEMKPF